MSGGSSRERRNDEDDAWGNGRHPKDAKAAQRRQRQADKAADRQARRDARKQR